MDGVKRLLDTLSEPFGDYAPRSVHLIVDFLDDHDKNCWQELTVIIPYNQTVQGAVSSVIIEVERRGDIVCCITEPLYGYTHDQITEQYETDPAAAMQNMRCLYFNPEVAGRV